MRRATLWAIARRVGWTLAYVAGVFLLVAALAYAEWRLELQTRAREFRHLHQNQGGR